MVSIFVFFLNDQFMDNFIFFTYFHYSKVQYGAELHNLGAYINSPRKFASNVSSTSSTFESTFYDQVCRMGPDKVCLCFAQSSMIVAAGLMKLDDSFGVSGWMTTDPDRSCCPPSSGDLLSAPAFVDASDMVRCSMVGVWPASFSSWPLFWGCCNFAFR